MNGLSRFNSERKPSAIYIQAAKVAIAELLLDITGVHTVILATTDGFEIATSSYRKELDSHKLAAVSSSILAMIQAFMGEINLTDCKSIMLDAQNGKAFIQGIPCVNYPLVLVILSNSDVLIGQLMHAMNKCSERLQKIDQRFS